MRRLLPLATTFALFACTEHSLQAPVPQPFVEQPVSTPVGPTAIDLLFVIDDSGSMRNNQENVRRNLPALLGQLERMSGGAPDLHVGVISTDVGGGPSTLAGNPACNRPGGDRGVLQVPSACSGTTARFLAQAPDGTKNFTGELADRFGCLAALGTGGCGFEQPLNALALALGQGGPADNAGFLRDHALLAIVIVSDEDDCSAPFDTDLYGDADPAHFPNQTANLRCYLRAAVCDGRPLPNGQAFDAPLTSCTAAPDVASPGPTDLSPVSGFVDLIRSLKRDPDRVVVAGLIGAPPDRAAAHLRIAPVDVGGGRQLLDVASVCDANGGAAPALRLEKFLSSFGPQAFRASICADDFGPALANIGAFIAAPRPMCLAAEPTDADPDRPGLQPECAVSERDDATGIERAVPACDGAGTARPCWRLADADSAEARECSAGPWRVVVEPAPGTEGTRRTQRARCASAAKPR